MSTRPAGELQALTGLRGIAALTVFIAHARYYEMVPALRPLLVFFEWHGLAVDLFFMLSGFVLIHVYAAKYEARKGTFWIPYYAARFARIVPLYLATLAACLGIFAAGSVVYGKWPAHITWDIVVTNLLLLQNWPGLFRLSPNIPSWSLSVEMFCYILVMPLALVLDRILKRNWVILALIVLLVAWRTSLASSDSGWIGLIRGISGFLVGSLLHKFHAPKGNRAVVFTTIVSSVIFVVLQSLVAWKGFPRILPEFTFPFLIQGLAGSVRSVVHHFFRTPLMLWLGDISYSTYLWHGPIFLATHSVIRPRMVAMPLYVRVAWIVFEFAFVLWISHLSYHRFELPLRRRLRS